uniref:Piwi domain-containing protein n=1 Tax=Glossina brevipalpis TaxID=37001 RepID=A0A1A9VZF3_9MUSC
MAKKTLLGAIVITRYNNKTHRIDDICFEKNPRSTFTFKEGTVSFLDHYRRNYNIEIKDKGQPILISIKKKRTSQGQQAEDLVICLIPELCCVTGLRDESPESRKILSDWGLSLVPNYEEVSGRKLDEEKLYFAKKGFSVGPNADFSRYLANELLVAVPIRHWILIYCEKDRNAANTFCEYVRKDASSCGMQVEKPRIIILHNDRIETYITALRANITKQTQIVVCICSKGKDDKYTVIKKICFNEIPVPSQFESKVFRHNIIIYRDGVSDGQLQVCENYEIPQLEETCRKLLEQVIKITFIVVKKHTNTRYFSMNQNGFESPGPGAIAGKTITRTGSDNFFLISQTVKRGTASPTHYIVLRDDAQFSPDIIQRLTYKLCFLYYNWPGTISAPACCMYAHKMALFDLSASYHEPTPPTKLLFNYLLFSYLLSSYLVVSYSLVN